MDLGIKDKVALVFAASKGLGKAAALALAKEGCKIAICSRNENNIAKTAMEIEKETGSKIFTSNVDVADKEQIENFVHAINKKWGSVDIVVNNAGGPPVATFEQSDEEGWYKWYDVTFMSVVRAIKIVSPIMKKNNWGRIINITSISVKSPVENLVYSNALRMAVIGLSKTISNELGPFGITVNNVAPGYHLTDGLERIIVKKVETGIPRKEVLEQWTKNVPMRRIGEAFDLANLITFLASDLSGYITGTTIQVDGGKYSGTL